MASLDWLAVWISLKVAILCVAVILLPGIAVGWLLARKDFRGKALVEALVHVPLLLPPVVTGYLLLLVLGRKGVVGHWLDAYLGIRTAFSLSGAVLAAAVMSFPLLVRSVHLAIALVNPQWETAAATLGAGPFRIFFTITLPLAAPGIRTGSLLAFARGLGEFGATMTFAGNIEGETRTIPLAVFTYMQVPGKEGAALSLAAVSIAIAFGALLVSEWLNRKAVLARGNPS